MGAHCTVCTANLLLLLLLSTSSHRRRSVAAGNRGLSGPAVTGTHWQLMLPVRPAPRGARVSGAVPGCMPRPRRAAEVTGTGSLSASRCSRRRLSLYLASCRRAASAPPSLRRGGPSRPLVGTRPSRGFAGRPALRLRFEVLAGETRRTKVSPLSSVAAVVRTEAGSRQLERYTEKARGIEGTLPRVQLSTHWRFRKNGDEHNTTQRGVSLRTTAASPTSAHSQERYLSAGTPH